MVAEVPAALHPRILLVGDSRATGGLLHYLAARNYRVCLAVEESAALARVAEAWDAIILDLSPPLDRCLEVLHHLRCEPSCDVPVLVLARQAGLEDRLRALDLGADCILQEPFDLAEVTARIDALHRRVTGTVVRSTAASPSPASSTGTRRERAHPAPQASTPAPRMNEAMPLSLPSLSVIIPAKDEADNLPVLLDEVSVALAGIDYEVLVVDDGSVDATWPLLVARAAKDRRIRPLRHRKSAGQSTSMWQAAALARGAWLATLDGDGQNDPADVPRLFARARRGGVTLVAGHRTQRRDDWMKRLSSRVANRFRSALLGDGTPDTGCGLKVIERAAFLSLPYFDHMHRFLPALIQAQGGRCVSEPVSHRARQAGRSHYGVNNRLWVGLIDIVGVLWLRSRSRLPAPLQGSGNLEEHREARDLEMAGGQG